MTSASPSPKSPEVSEKSKKYDRQLRLWGDHGQNKLERSQICLINANATGTEILKSLVLPGCGSFVIVDGHRVTQEDIGSNFFLDADSLNKSRAECALRLLSELNADVAGEAIADHPDSLLNTDPKFFNRFTVVIGCHLGERVLTSLSKVLWEHGIPFLHVQTTGMIGWIRIQLNEHTIIESHPDNPKSDLRLDVPFPELVSHMDSIQLVNREDSVKTPWLVLLFKALKAYISQGAQNEKCGDTDSPPERYPFTSKQKAAFKSYLKEFSRSLGLDDSDDSFEEAVKAVNTAVMRTTVPDEVKSILDDPKTSKPESKFWILCAALKEFINDKNGQLPVRGALPDMTADSEKYIKLQNVYRDKASKDANEIFDKACQIMKQSGKQVSSITVEEVRLFCKESHNLRLLRGYPIHEELSSSPNSVLTELAQNMEECDQELMFYIILRAHLRFHNEYGTYPGFDDSETDISRFKTTMLKILNEWNTSVVAREDCIHEICRYGGAEIPSVAAFIGGAAAHEVIKLITNQYVPLDNTFIYNAITSTTRSLKLAADL
ncbi:putative protein-activating enzyme E1 regulatory subunit [Orchesella cincta]|uniref:NEDD8-activating enzyme E1 regulatory subunit n=1 Tax=Orchesella cincta TaxID=48709 RepID=A0A1D2NF51_ORCCI|nr:putative protein-activating enzyme E1 regulatory subunit [Orchesella cincta]